MTHKGYIKDKKWCRVIICMKCEMPSRIVLTDWFFVDFFSSWWLKLFPSFLPFCAWPCPPSYPRPIMEWTNVYLLVGIFLGISSLHTEKTSFSLPLFLYFFYALGFEGLIPTYFLALEGGLTLSQLKNGKIEGGMYKIMVNQSLPLRDSEKSKN